MISDETLRIVLAIFFGLMGIIHFFYGKIMERYAVEVGLLNAEVAVKMSGALLLVSSAALFVEEYELYGFYGLCLFLILSSFILHKFWSKTDGVEQLVELLHFAKNIVLALVIWYLKDLWT